MNEIINKTNKEIASKAFTTNLLGSYLDENGNITATQYEKDKDGNLIEHNKLITNKDVAHALSATKVIDSLLEMGEKARCYNMGRIKTSVVKQFGYKSVTAFLSQNIASLTPNTCQTRIRVGKIFIVETLTTDKKGNTSAQYEYRDGIPFDAPISNLEKCLSLLTHPNGNKIDWSAIDNLTEKEIAAIVKCFVDKYIVTDLLHLSALQSVLVAEKKALVNGTTINTENGTTGSDNGTDNNGADDNGADDNGTDDNGTDLPLTTYETAISALDVLMDIFKGDTETLDILTGILARCESLKESYEK